MATAPSSETSRAQLAAVGLALGLATITFLVPLALVMLATTALVAFAAGAKSLHLAHGLDPGSFSAGFYLATLLLLGAGGWQVAHTVRWWRARRDRPPEVLDESEPKALVTAKPKGLPASLAERPWMLLGVALLLVDMFLVRWEIRGRLNSPDGLLAAAILASMVWATVFIAVMSVRLTGLLWRTLIRSSRRSPYTAGLVTAFSLAISLASVLAIRSYSRETAEAVTQQNVVTSIAEAPSSNSSLEQIRLALIEFADPKKPDDSDAQGLIKEALTPPQARVQPAPVPTPTPSAEDPLAPAALGVAGAGTAALLPAPERTVENPPPASPPIEAAAADTADPDAPLWEISFGPASTKCIDKLMKRRADGDPIEQHVLRLMRRFNELDRDKAHAIVIDALVSVCLKKADDPEDLSRYFSRSVTNAALNYVTRHLAKLRACPIEMVPVVDYPDESDGWHFADDTEQRAQRAFCKLSELDQAIIQARVVEELTFGRIGEVIGLTEDGARKAFDRALQRLKENFQKS